MTYKDLFKETISEAIKSARQVTDPYKKAEAMASVSQAIATYLAKGEIVNAAEDVVDEEPKTKAKKKTEKKAEPVEETAEAAEEAPAEEPKKEKKTSKKGANDMFKRHPRKTSDAEETSDAASEETAEVNTEEFTEEWTAEATAHFAEELGRLNEYKENFIEQSNDETMYDQMLDYATNGEFTSEAQVNPMNIQYVLTMLDAVAAADEEADEEADEA